MLLPQFIRESINRLQALYPPGEARSLVLLLCNETLGTQSYTHIVEPDYEISDADLAFLTAAVSRMADGEPLQYVTGVQVFCCRQFRVTPDVLIPRPETESLVAMALSRLSPGTEARILDLFTGSGCIAWTLALDHEGASVTGVDISPAALDVARSQISMLDVGTLRLQAGPLSSGTSRSALIPPSGAGPLPFTWPRAATVPEDSRASRFCAPTFLEQDITKLPEDIQGAPFDMITANPPYIRESEKSAMQRNVLEYEPSLALFVPDEDPLLFYKATALWAQRFLKPGGWGIAEINEALGEQTAVVFRDSGFQDVEKHSDFFGKDRFVSFKKPA